MVPGNDIEFMLPTEGNKFWDPSSARLVIEVEPLEKLKADQIMQLDGSAHSIINEM